MNISGKTIVISGGSGGIGSALIKKLYEQGATVYSLDIDKNIPEKIPGVHYITVDLTNSERTSEAIKLINDTVDILILNTGVMIRGTIFESSEEDFDALFNVNFKASWVLLKALHPQLAEDATIVQVSSGHALHPEADPGLYSLTKKTTIALAEMVAISEPSYDVRIVYPRPVLTKLLLSGRSEGDKERISKIAMSPDKFADKFIELLNSDSKTLKFVHETFDYVIE